MDRKAATPPSLAGMKNNDLSASSASSLNFLRISSCCSRLAVHVNTAPRNDTVEFFNLCFSLARGIDFAVSSNEIPTGARELPFLMKQVCRLKDESFLAAAILVLMISIKNACKRRWFSDQDSTELCRLTSELQSSFCTTMDFTTQPNSFHPAISIIMSRYYPIIKMGGLIAFLEIKAGYGTYVHDFQITKDMKSSQEERIMVFVAETDTIGTSSCLINPTDASVLINGKGVDKRRTNFMDTGPQMPTLVNHYLKYGTNLLQAVGQFNGNYIIVIAFMRMLSCPDHATLQDYVQPITSMVDSDPEIIEGSSRISLNCPISLKRINVPIKGHMCKHLQCIDYENYVEMNARRPSWRCPHCNQHVCFTDIRVDQNMVKVLMEIGKTVNNVTISSDGTWKPVAETDDHCDKPQEKDAEVSTEPVSQRPSDIPPDDIMDLTEDNYMDTMEVCEPADEKPFAASCQNEANKQDMALNSHIINTNEARQNSSVRVEDSFWSGIYLSTHESAVPNCHSESQTSAQRNADGKDTVMSRYASGRPVSVQALLVPSRVTSSLQQRQSDHPVIQNSSLEVPRTSAMSRSGESATTVPDIMEGQGQQNSTRTNSIPLQKSCQSSSRVQQYPISQTVGHQSPAYVKSSYKVTPVFPSANHNSSQQPTSNTRESINQASSLMRPSATLARPQTHQGRSLAGKLSSQRALELVAAQRAANGARVGLASETSSPYAKNNDRHGASMGGQRSNMPPSPSPRPPANAGVPVGMTIESNRQPSVGRMRGSLTGRAYLDAYNQYMTPTQQPQATTQPARASSQSASASSQPAKATLVSTKATLQPTTQSGQATLHLDRAKSPPATQQARATTHADQAIYPDRSRTHTAPQQAKAAIHPAKATTHSLGASTQPALSITQNAQVTHLYGAIKRPALDNTQQAQRRRHPVTATTQPTKATPQPDQVIANEAMAITERAKAITKQATPTIQQDKSTTPVSIASLLSGSASSRQEVLKANRDALAQAGIYPNVGSGSSSGQLFGWPSGKN